MAFIKIALVSTVVLYAVVIQTSGQTTNLVQPQVKFKNYRQAAFQDRAYILVFDPVLSWHESLYACATHYMQLVEIFSNEHLEFLKNFKEKASGIETVWVGASNFSAKPVEDQKRRDFRWIESNSIMEKRYFHLESPDDADQNELCIKLENRAEKDGNGNALPDKIFKADDAICEDQHAFVCQSKSFK